MKSATSSASLALHCLAQSTLQNSLCLMNICKGKQLAWNATVALSPACRAWYHAAYLVVRIFHTCTAEGLANVFAILDDDIGLAHWQ